MCRLQKFREHLEKTSQVELGLDLKWLLGKEQDTSGRDNNVLPTQSLQQQSSAEFYFSTCQTWG
jgi:hypothetical protein